MRKAWKLLAFVVVAVIAMTCKSDTKYSTQLSGTVLDADSAAPIAGANIVANASTGISRSDGSYNVTVVHDGVIDCVVSKGGYQTHHESIETTVRTYQHDVSLRSTTPTTHTLSITAEPGGTPNPLGYAGGPVQCSVSGEDSLDHALSYHWSANGGSFNNPNIRTPIWSGPANNGSAVISYTLTVTVSCSGGQSVSRTYVQRVNPQPPINDVLTITAEPSGNPNPVIFGGSVSFSVSATDSLGHTVSYRWGAPAGSFSSTTSRTPTWTAPENPGTTVREYTISVTVSCSGGQSVSRSYVQRVNPADVLSITSGPNGSPNPVASGGSVQLRLAVSDSLGHSNLSYRWSASEGSFSNTNNPAPIWTAPVNNSGSIRNVTISVTVSCSGGQSVSGSYTQQVNPQPTYSISDAWWSSKVDNDEDGARSSGVLVFDVNVTPPGTYSVYAEIYYATWPSGSFSFYSPRTNDFSIAGNSTSDSESVTIGYPGIGLSGPTNYKFRIDIYKAGTTSPILVSYGNNNDDDLNAELFELHADD